MALQIELGFSLFDWILAHLPVWITKWIPQIFIDKLRPVAADWQLKGEQLLSEKLGPITSQLQPVLKVLTDLKGSTVGLFDKVTKLATTVRTEYEAIRNFKEDLHWRGRVVNAPQVVKKVKRLTEIPSEVALKIKDLITRIEEQSPGGKSPAELADEAAADLEGIESFRGFLTKWVPKLAKGAERLLGVLAILVDVLVAWNAAIDDLQTIADDVKEVRLDIEKLDLIFLPQNNPRRWVTLEDGRRMRIRVGGHTHPS
jgi:hypothetical protein